MTYILIAIILVLIIAIFFLIALYASAREGREHYKRMYYRYRAKSKAGEREFERKHMICETGEKKE